MFNEKESKHNYLVRGLEGVLYLEKMFFIGSSNK